MEAKVVRWGDDLAVRLTPAEAEELGIPMLGETQFAQLLETGSID